MTLVLQVVNETLHRQSQRVYPGYEPDERFHPIWWRDGSAKSPVSYCRFLDNGEEVGRAKIVTQTPSLPYLQFFLSVVRDALHH